MTAAKKAPVRPPRAPRKRAAEVTTLPQAARVMCPAGATVADLVQLLTTLNPFAVVTGLSGLPVGLLAHEPLR